MFSIEDYRSRLQESSYILYVVMASIMEARCFGVEYYNRDEL